MCQRVTQIQKCCSNLKNVSFLQHHAVSLELCNQTWLEQGNIRLHLHEWIQSKQPRQIRVSELHLGLTGQVHKRELLQSLVDQEGRGASSQVAGCDYVMIPKLDQVFQSRIHGLLLCTQLAQCPPTTPSSSIVVRR